MDYTLRQASIADAHTLGAIGETTFRETFAAHYSAETMAIYVDAAFAVDKLRQELASNSSVFWILTVEERCGGYLKLNWGDAQTASHVGDGLEVERIYLSRAAQGRGLGRVLFDKARSVAEAMHKEFLWLGVWENNHPAIGFYRAQGFVEIGTHRFQMGDVWDTDLTMKLSLVT
ncbi:GNAT family N-acetyltransferase [Halomonas sp. V046]|uniref:GNAT family N-acetyltransferase n=1 Tax=Halomonas sp. V046 TaxID=3459611 RepID=UPI004043BDF5